MRCLTSLEIILTFLVQLSVGQEIANQKCHEYAKAVFQEGSILNPWSQHKIKVSTCDAIANPLIVGGSLVKRREFPHMALIGIGFSQRDKLRWECGGSLISDKHILTAAHCTNTSEGDPQAVRLGTVTIKHFDAHMQQYLIEKCIQHPEFNVNYKYNDLAVCILTTKVTFTGYVRPACLNTIHNLQFDTAIVTGFGKTDFFGQDMNMDLLKVEVDIIPRKECQPYLYMPCELPQNLTESLICAGDLDEGERDSCQGDSGGPLQVVLQNPYCMYSLIGVTSFGRYCGLEYSPGIYTNISYFVPWIESVVWP